MAYSGEWLQSGNPIAVLPGVLAHVQLGQLEAARTILSNAPPGTPSNIIEGLDAYLLARNGQETEARRRLSCTRRSGAPGRRAGTDGRPVCLRRPRRTRPRRGRPSSTLRRLIRSLTAGVRYTITLQFYEKAGGAIAKLQGCARTAVNQSEEHRRQASRDSKNCFDSIVEFSAMYASSSFLCRHIRFSTYHSSGNRTSSCRTKPERTAACN